MTISKIQINKTLYAVIFLILVPSGLLLWAKYTNHLINLPLIGTKITGYILIFLGVLFMVWAMYYLKVYGKGLPMNAYPPIQLVTTGPYRIFRHPIYWGFSFLMVGYFILDRSVAGLWLVSPITILAMVALVLGYEGIYLKKAFPESSLKTIFDIPAHNKESARVRERLVSLFWVIAPLFLGRLIRILVAAEQVSVIKKPTTMPFQFENQYGLILSLLIIGTMPFIIKRKDKLRSWVISSIIGVSILNFLTFFYPEVEAQLLPNSQGPFYSIPVFLLLISVAYAFKQKKILGALVGIIAVIGIAVQMPFDRSMIWHLSTSILLFLFADNYISIWGFFRNSSERIANSWKEWVFGKIRVINHGFYVGLGSFIGILLAGLLVGDAYAWAILLFAIVVIVFSAIWAQVVEGSEKLKRPYGYYGGLVGILFGSLAVWALGFNVWVIIGVISVVMPWVQGIGRLRCLVNGCCHGGKINNPLVGIKYFHFRSRVCGISDLKGELLHPTPVYAMLWLFVVGWVLLSLFDEFSPSFIFGLYLILTGIGRFAEEAYRGEVQTPQINGLRLYQWTAILSVLVGVVMTTITVEKIDIVGQMGWETLASALIGGLFTTFAMGVDFPYSNARFSRLV